VFPNPDAAEKGDGGALLEGGVLGDAVKEWQCISVSVSCVHVPCFVGPRFVENGERGLLDV
jgi:hypothetical protein